MNEATALAKQEYMEQETMTLEQAEKFVHENLYKITDQNNFERCVDGRYNSSIELGASAKPGGSAGDVLVSFAAIKAMNLEVQPEVILKTVLNYLGGAQKFHFHTDQHAEHDHVGTGMGCGHLKHARNDAESYGMNKDQVEFLFGKLDELKTEGAEQSVLEGEHQEKATIIIESENYSLKPVQIMPDGSKLEAFIYQKTLDEASILKLAKALQQSLLEMGIQKDFDEIHQKVVEASALQRAETLKRLTAHLPRYLASVDKEGNISVKEL